MIISESASGTHQAGEGLFRAGFRQQEESVGGAAGGARGWSGARRTKGGRHLRAAASPSTALSRENHGQSLTQAISDLTFLRDQFYGIILAVLFLRLS